MNIAIIGTRGIPNNYGGFEQFAEYLSTGLSERGHSVSVYNSHNHLFQHSKWNNIDIVHCFDPEYLLGTFGQFIYDFNCILDARKKHFDIILQLGYTSSSIWSFLFPKKSKVITNMDGLEWKRTKYSKPVRNFLKYAEKLAVKNSHLLISDSIGIQNYLKNEYKIKSTFIPYAAVPFIAVNSLLIDGFDVKPYEYDLLIARMEEENNIETILEGVRKAKINRKFLVIGSHKNSHGQYLKKKFESILSIRFIGAVYDLHALNNLRYFSNLYFHGHSVGGTNPSLLEAMASCALICAHRNVFNLSVVENDAYYFECSKDVADILQKIRKDDSEKNKIDNNARKIAEVYNWKKVIDQHEQLFLSILSKK